VTTVAALRCFSEEQLRGLFGVRGDALHERCRGRDSRVIAAREIPASISRETAFHTATSDPEEHRSMLYYLVERAARAARTLGIAPRTIAVKIRYADDHGEESRRTFRHGVAVDARLFETACELLRRVRTRRVALHLVGVTLSSFVPDHAEQLDFTSDARAPRARDLCDGLDRVRGRYGHSAVVAGASIGLLGKLNQDAHGFVLRTPSLTK
jgi:DNA polymerase-4